MNEVTRSKCSKEEWEAMEKEFFDIFINGYVSELLKSIECLGKNEEYPLIRSQACIAFIAIDTFSRIDLIFKGERDVEILNKNNEKRFNNWLKEYLFTDKNEFYKKNTNKIKCNASLVWKMRNSFLHFYSFPKLKNKYICLSLNISDRECLLIEKKLKSHFTEQISIISLSHLLGAVFRGLFVQIQDLKKMIDNEPEKYRDSIYFANKILQGEGAKTIQLK